MEKVKIKRTNVGRIRPLSDKAWWDQIAVPLLGFLSTWRSWADLTRWRIENKVKEPEIINALAYLHINRRARYRVATKMWGPLTDESSEVAIERTGKKRPRSRTRSPETPQT